MDVLINKTSKVYHDYPSHRHSYWEILVNFQGSGTAFIGSREYSFQPGTIFCIRPGVAHKKVSRDGFSDGSVFVQNFIADIGEDVLQYEDDADGTFQKLFELAFEIHVKADPNAEDVVRSLIESMQQLLRSWKRLAPRSTPVQLFQKKLIDNVTNCDFNLTEAVASTGYCPSYFRRMFKEAVGHSPVNYFHYLRVQFAKTQLIQYSGIRSIHDISRSSGFNDPYYFSRIFKKFTGVSPQQYVLDSRSSALNMEQLAADASETGGRDAEA